MSTGEGVAHERMDARTHDAGIASRVLLDVPIRQVTSDAKAHWFGYYDIAAFGDSGTRVLACASDFEWRAPRPSDALEVGVIDLEQSDRFTPLGTSRSWGWQQGCLLQWRPQHRDHIVWNDRIGDARVTRLLDIGSSQERIVESGFYSVSPDGKSALGCDLERLAWMRPGYGSASLYIHEPRERAPNNTGVTRIDLESGEQRLVVSLAALEAFETEPRSRRCWHYVNHLSFSPDGHRFAVIHRWRRNLRTPRAYRAVAGFGSRLIVGNIDGSRLQVIDDSGHTSHYAWRGPDHLVAWTRPRGKAAGLYSFEVGTGRVTRIPGFVENGHHSYLKLEGESEPSWMLNDTYPKLGRLRQELYLVHLSSGRRFDLGSFPIAGPLKIGETRCDLHPRFSPDGRRVCFDSAHSGRRQLYIAELGDRLRELGAG